MSLSLPAVALAWQPAPIAAHCASTAWRAPAPTAHIECELLRNGLAAFGASATATMLLHPLDTLKTRLQSDAYAVTAPAGTLRRVRPTAGDPRQRLLTGLYSGIGANVLKEAPDAAVFLALSEEVSRSLSMSSPWFATHVTITLLLSGAIGDACGSVLRLPAEVVCKKLQTGTGGGNGAGWQGALAETSWDSWMASWAAIVARDVPMGGLQIAAYQQTRLLVQEARSSAAATHAAAAAAAASALEQPPLELPAVDGLEESGLVPLVLTYGDSGRLDLGHLGSPGTSLLGEIGTSLDEVLSSIGSSLTETSALMPDSMSDVAAGVCAGAVAAALTTPLDVLVTHVSTTESTASPDGVQRGALQRGIDLVRDQGALTLTRGLGYRTLYYAPLVGCFFGFYEHFRHLLEGAL